MLYNQTYNLDQVAFAADGLKDAQQTVCPQICSSSNLFSVEFILAYNTQFYLVVYFTFSDECDEGGEQGAQGNDENGQD